MNSTKLILILLGLFWGVSVNAQSTDVTYYSGLSVGVKTGAYRYLGNAGTVTASHLSMLSGFNGLFVEKGFTEKITVGGQFNMGSIRMAPTNYTEASNGFKSDLLGGSVYAKVLLFPENHKDNLGNMLPFVSVGMGYTMFTQYKDSLAADGSAYHYWSDGTIRNNPESYDNAFQSVMLQKDGEFETQMSNGGFLTVPVGGGVDFKLGRRFHAQAFVHYNIGLTGNVDGVVGRGGLDGFWDGGFSLTYRLSETNQKDFAKKEDNIPKELFAAVLKSDVDGDGILDLVDDCQKTPEGVSVDMKGCPLDADKDGIPDYRDEEKNSTSKDVNEHGVAYTEHMNKVVQSKYDGHVVVGKKYFLESRMLFFNVYPPKYNFKKVYEKYHKK